MASLQALQRNILRAGGTATAASILATCAGDRTAVRVSNHTIRKCGLHSDSPMTTPTPYSTSTVTSMYSSMFAVARRQPQHRGYSTTPEPASPAKSRSLMEWYEGHLQANPLPTKMITGGTLWSVGDAVAQVVPQVAGGDTQGLTPFQYDWERTGRAAFFGFAVHAPTSHVHFNFLEWMTQKGGFSGLYIPVFKTVMEQFVYWSWISNSMYHAFMGYTQGMRTPEVIQRIEDVLWDTQKAQWAFWIPVQLLNFQFIPVRHQLNVVLVTSIVWTALLSAWYPPVGDGDETTEATTSRPEDVKKT